MTESDPTVTQLDIDVEDSLDEAYAITEDEFSCAHDVIERPDHPIPFVSYAAKRLAMRNLILRNRPRIAQLFADNGL